MGHNARALSVKEVRCAAENSSGSQFIGNIFVRRPFLCYLGLASKRNKKITKFLELKSLIVRHCLNTGNGYQQDHFTTSSKSLKYLEYKTSRALQSLLHRKENLRLLSEEICLLSRFCCPRTFLLQRNRSSKVHLEEVPHLIQWTY